MAKATKLRRPYIVAELSANHEGSLERALKTVTACARAGVDAVKLQTWTPGKMVLDTRYVLEDGPWRGSNLASLYERAHTPWNWHGPIFARAAEAGIECFSTAFDAEALAFLESLECPRYKVASFELVDTPLIAAIARTGKPMIMSTGMADEPEIREAVLTARAEGAKDLTLLKCTSAYPAEPSSANLTGMRGLGKRYECHAGLSDHTQGIGTAIAAAALGAAVIEKHVKLDHAGGLDDAFSVVPEDLRRMVDECRAVVDVLGKDETGPIEAEEPQRRLRRSIYFARTVLAGDRVGPGDVRTARPAEGLAPRFIGRVIGATLTADGVAGCPVTWEHIGGKPSLRRP